MKSNDLRAEAETLYVRRGMKQEEIAERLSVAPRTIARWAKEQSWQSKREEFRTSSPQAAADQIRQRFNALCASISADPAQDKEKADELSKLTSVLKFVEQQEEAVGPVLAAMDRFARFVAATCDARQMNEIRDVVNKFLEGVRNGAT